MSDIEDA